ncbi:hypothetical protein [Parasphingorhabdus sp.]|jgi:hypothetical protein|uniref:hypothetical protein n=1 Tax=Parasphingorhabdus sp. TaxID=2709688 RepID=UPI0030B41196|nr:hypothetical protein [Sphingomonadales bacterium]
MIHGYSRALILPVACGAMALAADPASAQVSLNYDSLSSFEEPLAFEIGEATVQIGGVVDVPVTLALDDGISRDDVNVSLVTNLDINVEIQIANRWNVGLAYFGQYDENTDDYVDNVAGFVRTSWGSLIGGNVNGLVREATRRRRGVGNAHLAFDDFYGRINQWGGSYSGRFGPTVLTGIVDGDGHFELGAQFQRPIGRKDYRLTTRVAKARYLAADGLTDFITIGAGAVAEFVYGSSLFDLGFGYENLKAGAIDLDRWYVSGGAQTKIGVLSLSVDGHYGELDGTSESSASLGVRYDIARGLSTILGVNTRKAQIARDGVSVVDEDEATATASVRYSF